MSTSATKDRNRRKGKKASAASRKVSRLRKPEGLSLEAWQTELRRQFGREQGFSIRNIGDDPIFSEFLVTNRESGNTYRVAIRGAAIGANYCSCPDFATNSLGTCKHVEFVLGKLEERRGGKRALAAGFLPPFSEIFLRYGAQRQVQLRPGGECPQKLARLASEFFDEDGTLRGEAFATFDTFLARASAIDHELRVYEDVLSFVAEVRDGAHRKARLDELFPDGVTSAAFDGLLKVPLYDYQRAGALFAARAGRALIGDEMGLGKTIQALAAAEILARHFGVERVLIVCPASLKHQWAREIERFTDRSALVIGGLLATRRQQFRQENFYKITNYDTVYRDLGAIAEWAPDLVILDEAQRIKNWSTRTARSVKKIKAPYAVVLTGTPLENRLEELVSIVQFVDMHRLGPTYRLLDEHQVRDEFGRVIGYRNLDRLGKTLEPVLIRRQKDQVLDQLPDRIDQHFFVQMTAQQQQHHEENREIVARIVRKWRRYGFLSEADQRRLLIALQNMRMSCDSTYLLDKTTDFGVKSDEIATLLEELFEQPDLKVVLFSQWTRMHEVLLRRFDARGWDYAFFHGGVDSRDRHKLIDRFRNDEHCRAFLSTDAGGVGLNLQHASVVVNIDLPWNPAVLEQRIGRVHRLGQTRAVQAVHFVAQGTIEEGMLSVLSFKKSLFAGVLDGGEKEVFLGGSRLTKFMETVESVTSKVGQLSPEIVEPSVAASTAAEPEDDEPAERAMASPDRPTTNGEPVSAAGGESLAQVPGPDRFANLVQSGFALLQQLAGQFTQRKANRESHGHSDRSPAAAAPVRMSRDEQTGRPTLNITLPEPEVLDEILGAVSTFLDDFRTRRS